MKDSLKEAEEFLKGGSVDPHTAVALRSKLTGEYSFYSSIYQEILARKSKTWLSLRDTCSSDSQADRKYDMTEDGINEIGLKLKLKVIEKMMSQLRIVIDLNNNERNNSGY